MAGGDFDVEHKADVQRDLMRRQRKGFPRPVDAPEVPDAHGGREERILREDENVVVTIDKNGELHYYYGLSAVPWRTYHHGGTGKDDVDYLPNPMPDKPDDNPSGSEDDNVDRVVGDYQREHPTYHPGHWGERWYPGWVWHTDESKSVPKPGDTYIQLDPVDVAKRAGETFNPNYKYAVWVETIAGEEEVDAPIVGIFGVKMRVKRKHLVVHILEIDPESGKYREYSVEYNYSDAKHVPSEHSRAHGSGRGWTPDEGSASDSTVEDDPEEEKTGSDGAASTGSTRFSNPYKADYWAYIEWKRDYPNVNPTSKNFDAYVEAGWEPDHVYGNGKDLGL